MTVKFATGAGQIKAIFASGDVKPTTYPNGNPIENGAAIWEYDTDTIYITYDHGTHWVAHYLKVDMTKQDCSALPTADPHILGRLWIDPTAHLVVSAG